MKLEATMPCDGILRGLRIAGVACVRALCLNDEDLLSGARLQPELVAGEALDWGHVNEGDKVELCVELKPKETPQAMLLVEPKRRRVEHILVVRSKRVPSRERQCIAWYGASTETTVNRVVITPDSSAACMVQLEVMNAVQDPVLKVAAPASFFATTEMKLVLEAEHSMKIWLTNTQPFGVDVSATVYGVEGR